MSQFDMHFGMHSWNKNWDGFQCSLLNILTIRLIRRYEYVLELYVDLDIVVDWIIVLVVFITSFCVVEVWGGFVGEENELLIASDAVVSSDSVETVARNTNTFFTHLFHV